MAKRGRKPGKAEAKAPSPGKPKKPVPATAKPALKPTKVAKPTASAKPAGKKIAKSAAGKPMASKRKAAAKPAGIDTSKGGILKKPTRPAKPAAIKKTTDLAKTDPPVSKKPRHSASVKSSGSLVDDSKFETIEMVVIGSTALDPASRLGQVLSRQINPQDDPAKAGAPKAGPTETDHAEISQAYAKKTEAVPSEALRGEQMNMASTEASSALKPLENPLENRPLVAESPAAAEPISRGAGEPILDSSHNTAVVEPLLEQTAPQQSPVEAGRATETPAAPMPFFEKSFLEKSSPERSPAPQPWTEKSVSERASFDKPIAEKPAADRSFSSVSFKDAPGAVPPPEMNPAELQATALLFEIGWEVCWQLGGIYTVLRSKAPAMIQRWGDRYCLIGPYNPQTAAVEFEEQPTDGIIRRTLDRLRGQGIGCHYGRWLIPGRPRVILLDYRGRYWNLHNDKYLLWKDHGISTVDNDGEVNEVTAFGFTVAEFFIALSAETGGNQPVVAHFHEWMAGIAVPRIAHLHLPVVTVFTTHATLLGRYMASDSAEFYNHLPFVNPDEQATKYNIYPRFAIERAAAHASTVFTTVSEVTNFEAEKLLGRRPDLILPNGLNIRRFAALHEFQNLHLQYKETINEFVMGHFFPGYTFDLDRTIYLFTSGRYEYRNKGMDVFIEAMHRLNWRLKEMPDRPTVVAFIVTKAATRHINVGVLQSQSMFDELRKHCETIQQQMGQRLFHSAARGRLPTIQELLDEDESVRLKQAIHAWRNGRQPPIVTHDLVDDANDPVLQHLRHRQLFNAADDPVKMIFHPQFVTATSPLISLDYEQFVRGCHMGVFPSYYEPWGYTPMECAALGLPSVTTDLSGFGAYVQSHVPEHDHMGIRVLNRRYRSFDDTVNELVEHLVKFLMLTRRQRIEMRNRVERLSELFDWTALMSHYNDAHDLALSRGGVNRVGKLDIRLI